LSRADTDRIYFNAPFFRQLGRLEWIIFTGVVDAIGQQNDDFTFNLKTVFLLFRNSFTGLEKLCLSFLYFFFRRF